MKLFHVLTYTKPTDRVSWKVLLYAALCTLFGTACLYCFIQLLFMEAEKHPYDQPATAVCLLVAFLLFCSVFALWGFTLSAVPRKELHGWLTAAVALIGFGPSFMLMNLIYHYGEKLGQMILYG